MQTLKLLAWQLNILLWWIYDLKFYLKALNRHIKQIRRSNLERYWRPRIRNSLYGKRIYRGVRRHLQKFFIATIDPIQKVNFVTNHIPDFYVSRLLQPSPSRPCWPRFLSRVKDWRLHWYCLPFKTRPRNTQRVSAILNIRVDFGAWLWRQFFIFHVLFRRQPVLLWPLVEGASVWLLC